MVARVDRDGDVMFVPRADRDASGGDTVTGYLYVSEDHPWPVDPVTDGRRRPRWCLRTATEFGDWNARANNALPGRHEDAGVCERHDQHDGDWCLDHRHHHDSGGDSGGTSDQRDDQLSNHPVRTKPGAAPILVGAAFFVVELWQGREKQSREFCAKFTEDTERA